MLANLCSFRADADLDWTWIGSTAQQPHSSSSISAGDSTHSVTAAGRPDAASTTFLRSIEQEMEDLMRVRISFSDFGHLTFQSEYGPVSRTASLMSAICTAPRCCYADWHLHCSCCMAILE